MCKEMKKLTQTNTEMIAELSEVKHENMAFERIITETKLLMLENNMQTTNPSIDRG